MSQSEFLEEIYKLKISATDLQLKQLEEYYNMLIKYNEKVNLTRIIKKEDVYLKHFYDSLTLTKILDLTTIENLCDIGTGAGFPGIVLKIFYPNLKIVLVDSLNKRVVFLNQVIKQLQLKNIVAVHDRIEDFCRKTKIKFDLVTARAVAPLNILIEYSMPIVKVSKYFVAMKGNIQNETNYDNALFKLYSKIVDIKEFKLPLEESNRCLIKIQKMKETLPIFPRKSAEIKHNPL